MKYITGTQALNLHVAEDMAGDWHFTTQDWSNLDLADTENHPLGEWGIGIIEKRFEKPTLCAMAHRACFDLVLRGQKGIAFGMRDDFVCNENHTYDILKHALLLRNHERWNDVDQFMGKEYQCLWLDAKEGLI